jgi:hypothetical protein
MEQQPQVPFSGGSEAQSEAAPSPQPDNGQRPRSKVIPIIAIVVIIIAFVYAANNGSTPEVPAEDETEMTATTTDEMVDEEEVVQPVAPVTPPVDTNEPAEQPEETDEEVVEAGDGCVVMGCNNEVCTSADKPVFTACVVLDEHACYQTATCEKQSTGECGWTQTTELRACLEASRS